MTKKRVGSQISNLTCDHSKSEITLIYLCVGGVPHTVEKILTRAITLLQTSFQSEVYTQNYGPPKLRKSQFKVFRDSNLGISKQKEIWVLAPWLGTNNTTRGEVVATPNLGCDESCESTFAHGLSMHQKCSNYALTNLLFSLCRSM
jgi:hypothetical protein